MHETNYRGFLFINTDYEHYQISQLSLKRIWHLQTPLLMPVCVCKTILQTSTYYFFEMWFQFYNVTRSFKVFELCLKCIDMWLGRLKCSYCCKVYNNKTNLWEMTYNKTHKLNLIMEEFLIFNPRSKCQSY